MSSFFVSFCFVCVCVPCVRACVFVRSSVAGRPVCGATTCSKTNKSLPSPGGRSAAWRQFILSHPPRECTLVCGVEANRRHHVSAAQTCTHRRRGIVPTRDVQTQKSIATPVPVRPRARGPTLFAMDEQNPDTAACLEEDGRD